MPLPVQPEKQPGRKYQYCDVCRKKHAAERARVRYYEDSGRTRAYRRAYYQAHRERFKQANATYRAKQRKAFSLCKDCQAQIPRRTVRCPACKEANRKASLARYRERHQEEIRQHALAWQERHPERYREIHRRAARTYARKRYAEQQGVPIADYQEKLRRKCCHARVTISEKGTYTRTHVLQNGAVISSSDECVPASARCCHVHCLDCGLERDFSPSHPLCPKWVKRLVEQLHEKKANSA